MKKSQMKGNKTWGEAPENFWYFASADYISLQLVTLIQSADSFTVCKESLQKLQIFQLCKKPSPHHPVAK